MIKNQSSVEYVLHDTIKCQNGTGKLCVQVFLANGEQQCNVLTDIWMTSSLLVAILPWREAGAEDRQHRTQRTFP